MFQIYSICIVHSGLTITQIMLMLLSINYNWWPLLFIHFYIIFPIFIHSVFVIEHFFLRRMIFRISWPSKVSKATLPIFGAYLSKVIKVGYNIKSFNFSWNQKVILMFSQDLTKGTTQKTIQDMNSSQLIMRPIALLCSRRYPMFSLFLLYTQSSSS